jgi:hypothetical protein
VPKFRKRQAVIEAYQVPHPDQGYRRTNVPTWMMQAIIDRNIVMDPAGGAMIHTLEGTMRVDVFDWVIRGVKGELYHCKPDIFEAIYEPIDGEA